MPMAAPVVGVLSAHTDLFSLFQWPTLRTLTTRPRSPPFTAINAGSHARGRCSGSRPSTSTSNVSPAKVRGLQLPGSVACRGQCFPWGLSRPLCTPSHQMMSEHAQKPGSHLASLVWIGLDLGSKLGPSNTRDAQAFGCSLKFLVLRGGHEL